MGLGFCTKKKMESFKVCEREAKTKAYSKEGLSQQPKLDPSEQKLEEAKSWVTDVIDRLGVQVEEYECRLEDLSSKGGSGGEALSETQLEDIVGRHRMHVEKLEVVLRLLDNHEVNAGEVERIKDDVEYYMESHVVRRSANREAS
jgi:CCR4-NOT transcription complex subunit 3